MARAERSNGALAESREFLFPVSRCGQRNIIPAVDSSAGTDTSDTARVYLPAVPVFVQHRTFRFMISRGQVAGKTTVPDEDLTSYRLALSGEIASLRRSDFIATSGEELPGMFWSFSSARACFPPVVFAVDCVHSHPPIRRCCSISLVRLRGTTLRPAKGRATERLLRRQPLQTLLRWTVQGFSSFPDRPPGLQPTSLTTAVPRTRFSMLQQRLGEAHSPQSPAPDRSARSSYIHDADASS